VRIIPANALFDLGWALYGAEPLGNQADPKRRRVEQALTALLGAGGLPATLVAALQDYQDSDEKERLPGTEKLAYLSSGKGFGPRNGKLARPEEALLVRGWEDVSPRWLRQRFTTWGESEPKLNINFAPVETLTALIPELAPFAGAIVAYRQGAGFGDLSQLASVTGMSAETLATVNAFLTVRSSVFQVEAWGEAPGWAELRRYVVSRADTTGELAVLASDIVWTGPR
jgi:type II secretory pathway component PulK